MTNAGAPAQVTGRTTITPDDGAVVMRASRARLGFFNQPRMLLYCAVVGLIAASEALVGNRVASIYLFWLGLALFAAAVFAGFRTSRSLSTSFGRGQEREIVLDEDGITVRDPGKTLWEAWSAFDRAFEAPKHFVLLAGPGIVVVPKRAFAANDLERIRAVIASRLVLRALR